MFFSQLLLSLILNAPINNIEVGIYKDTVWNRYYENAWIITNHVLDSGYEAVYIQDAETPNLEEFGCPDPDFSDIEKIGWCTL